MRDLALVWDALRNLGGAVRRDPIWAANRLILAPVRLFQYLVATAAIVLIAAFILGLAASFIPPQWTVLRTTANVAVLLVLVGLALRHLTGRLVTQFGTAAGDTYGSARFATDREIALLTRTNAGLLIGQDRSTGRLLHYDGPAQLLTMAPTRTGIDGNDHDTATRSWASTRGSQARAAAVTAACAAVCAASRRRARSRPHRCR